MSFAPPAPPPPAAVALTQTAPPLSFSGFRAGMPLAEARTRIRSAGGSLSCKNTSDPRMRECTGRMPLRGFASPLGVLISAIHDSAAVLVFSTTSPRSISEAWVVPLTRELGRPNHERQPTGLVTWQWVRAKRMLRVVERKRGSRWEASATLTHGPLLDGLGAAQTKRPD